MESPPEFDVDYFAAGTTEKDQGSKLVKEANLEQKVGQVADEHESLPHHLKRLFLYCSLFPSGYEFSKDELIQLWIAEGFIRERQNQRMEDTASEHFNSLETEGFFVLSRCDFTSVLSAPTGNFLYKVNPIKHSILGDMISSGNYFRAVDGKLDGASEMTRHLSLICEGIDGMTFGILQNFKHLRTLHLISCRGSSIKHVPRDFCFTLTFLRSLNLSGTLISELPSSIGNVKSLRYIDASHTPISRLPESIDSLHKLQTIKLRGCIHFVQLPKGMKKLSNLRHIDLDIIRQLDSMPAHLGNLSNLQTLPAFLVGRDDGCHVGELKNLNDLKGAFNISRLENVLSTEDAGEAALIDKKGIHSLELRWSNLFVENAEQQEKVLECLQPHSGLKELQIQQYSGSVLPTWISNPAFADLVAIILYRCQNCKLLPCMGQLPALKSLSIIEVNEVKEINHQFFRNGPVDHAFPKLERLEVDILLNLEEWKDVQMGDLPSLVKFTVDSCPELVTIPPLSCLKSLKHLEFRRCPKLLSLPTDGLPTSLESFLILDCLELKEWCLNSEHWSLLCHVPSVWFDHEEVKGPCGMTNEFPAQVSAVYAEAQSYTHILTEYSSSLLATSSLSATSLPQGPAFTWTMDPQEMVSLSDYERHSVYNCCFPSSATLYWFNHPSSGSSVTVPLPPNLHFDTDWIGMAVCSCFSFLEHSNVGVDNLDIPGISHHLTCHLESDRGSQEPLIHSYCTTNEEFQWLGGFTWISYIPRSWFLDRLNECSVLKASIGSDCKTVRVHNSELRCVYLHDEEEFKETISHCMTTLCKDKKENKHCPDSTKRPNAKECKGFARSFSLPEPSLSLSTTFLPPLPAFNSWTTEMPSEVPQPVVTIKRSSDISYLDQMSQSSSSADISQPSSLVVNANDAGSSWWKTMTERVFTSKRGQIKEKGERRKFIPKRGQIKGKIIQQCVKSVLMLWVPKGVKSAEAQALHQYRTSPTGQDDEKSFNRGKQPLKF